MSSSLVYLPWPVLPLSLLVPSSQFFTQSEIEPRNIFRSLGKGLPRLPPSLSVESRSHLLTVPLGGGNGGTRERREERENENENEGVWISKLEPSPVVVVGGHGRDFKHTLRSK